MDVKNIGFCGFWGSFDEQNNFFTKILKKYFNVNIVDLKKGEKPDYLICSNRGIPFEYSKYDCVRIMFMGENISPDFTTFDYVIGFDRLVFGDRYFRLPLGLFDLKINTFVRPTINEAKEILKNKKYFCNFVYGHKSKGLREDIFYKLQEYKSVVSPGRFLNNCNTSGCSWKEKYEYLKLSKFTISGDSIQYPGFMTEKIIQPFLCNSIPIYSGDITITTDINPDSFINVRSLSELDEIVELIKEIDSNDDLYIKMLTADVFNNEHYLKDLYSDFEEFLVNIFSHSSPELSRRRISGFCADEYNQSLCALNKITTTINHFTKKYK